MNGRLSGSRARSRVVLLALLLVAMAGSLAACASGASGAVFTDNVACPLDGATAAVIDINAGDGHLAIDGLAPGEPLLASGALQYLEGQGRPTQTVAASNGQAALTLAAAAAERSGFRWPWAACDAATEWQVHLNPAVSSAITAHSNGGNVRLDLAGMAVTRVAADTSGGNMDLLLPDGATGLSVLAESGGGNVTVEIGDAAGGSNSVSAKSGAGNVVVRIPNGMAARIRATTGMGKVILDPRFSQISKDTYQSSGFDAAADKVDLTLDSGAGNVTVTIK